MLRALLTIFGNYARIILISPNFAPLVKIMLIGFKEN